MNSAILEVSYSIMRVTRLQPQQRRAYPMHSSSVKLITEKERRTTHSKTGSQTASFVAREGRAPYPTQHNWLADSTVTTNEDANAATTEGEGSADSNGWGITASATLLPGLLGVAAAAAPLMYVTWCLPVTLRVMVTGLG
jgi:hypothetical protein